MGVGDGVGVAPGVEEGTGVGVGAAGTLLLAVVVVLVLPPHETSANTKARNIDNERAVRQGRKMRLLF